MLKTIDFFNNQHSLSDSTKKNYRYALKNFEELTGERFEQTYLDSKKVHLFLNKLSKKANDSTWNLHLSCYKRLAKFLSDPDDEVMPKLWRKIDKKKIDWEKRLKDKYLTKKEFYKLLDVVDNTRDKALFSVCVEGALRLGELLGLRIKDVESTSYGYDVTVSGKTGSSTFPVVLFAPLLTQWLNQHPFKNDKLSPLWTKQMNGKSGDIKEGLKETGVHERIIKYGKRAGLGKISLHWLRHTKITWTAKDKKVRISDEMAKKMFRWEKNSNMYSRYTHLHGTDSKEAFLSLAGVKVEEEKEQEDNLVLKKCLNCGESNSATMRFCGKCGFVLSEEEAKKMIEQKKLNDAFIKLSMIRLKMDKELAEYEKGQEIKERKKG